ncbi:hypothetical protein GCM10023116_11200 [Kistimonas scapharcae]|uniref:Uncharacterized protein n=1 Tax=Kistimonas scapharcae TaxID=1036133 RepID=A0ABP8V0V6_9GAMM
MVTMHQLFVTLTDMMPNDQGWVRPALTPAGSSLPSLITRKSLYASFGTTLHSDPYQENAYVYRLVDA